MMQVIGTWIAAGLTLSIFSFLYRDNPAYKFAEHLYVGVSAAFAVLYTWAFDIWPMLVDPIFRGQGVKTPLDRWILIVPAIFGLLMLARWFPRWAWLSRWSISLTVGIAAGLGIIGQIQGILLPQIQGTILPLNTINNVILVIGVITTLIYFYFSSAHRGLFKWGAKIGVVFIMISFGASFGYTVMARISLLIGRLNFLINDWLNLIR